MKEKKHKKISKKIYNVKDICPSVLYLIPLKKTRVLSHFLSTAIIATGMNAFGSVSGTSIVGGGEEDFYGWRTNQLEDLIKKNYYVLVNERTLKEYTRKNNLKIDEEKLDDYKSKVVEFYTGLRQMEERWKSRAQPL